MYVEGVKYFTEQKIKSYVKGVKSGVLWSLCNNVYRVMVLSHSCQRCQKCTLLCIQDLLHLQEGSLLPSFLWVYWFTSLRRQLC